MSTHFKWCNIVEHFEMSTKRTISGAYTILEMDKLLMCWAYLYLCLCASMCMCVCISYIREGRSDHGIAKWCIGWHITIDHSIFVSFIRIFFITFSCLLHWSWWSFSSCYWINKLNLDMEIFWSVITLMCVCLCMHVYCIVHCVRQCHCAYVHRCSAQTHYFQYLYVSTYLYL